MIRNIVCLAIVLSPVSSLAADPPKPSAEEVAIRKLIDSYVDAFNRGDAEAVAKHFSETGAYIDPLTGEREVGRAAIAKSLAARFAGDAKPKLSVQVDSVRLLDDKVALEEGSATVVAPDSPPEVTTYLAVHVKKDGKWLLDSVRETTMPEPEIDVSNPMDELGWMVGRWIDKSDNAAVETVCDWTLNQNFLTRTFTMAIKGQPVMAGTQVIAWDAANKRIRSWVFDSDGSFGEGEWTHEGDIWTIRAAQTLSDGRKGTGVQIITKIDDDSFTFQSIARQVDGELLPNIEPITIIRKAD